MAVGGSAGVPRCSGQTVPYHHRAIDSSCPTNSSAVATAIAVDSAAYLFSPVGTSRCIGPRTVPVRSGLSGAQTANFSRPLLTSDALRTGTVRGPLARAATTLNRYGEGEAISGLGTPKHLE